MAFLFAASQFQHEIDSLADRFDDTTPVLLDVQRSLSELDTLIREHDLVIRLAPFRLLYLAHPFLSSQNFRSFGDAYVNDGT